MYAVVSADEAAATPYPYVWVNEDLSARELHANERRYLETPFIPSDGGRPYVKAGLMARAGGKRLSGFCHRRHLPPWQLVSTAPTEDPNPPIPIAQLIKEWTHRDPRAEVVNREDGTIEIRIRKGEVRKWYDVFEKMKNWFRG